MNHKNQMPMPTNNSSTYTYRNGKKPPLRKMPDQIVARVKPEQLKAMGFETVEQVSPASTRIRMTAAEVEPAMSRLREVAPTHHAYVREATEEEFLITDRLFITFKEGISEAEVDTFAGKYALVKKKKYNERDYLFQLTDHTGMNPVKVVVRLTEDEPLVELADHSLNHRMKKYDFELPDDPEYFEQWHLHRHHLNLDFDLRSSTRCEEAWQLLGHYGSPDVVVGITDDGCRMDHVDFNSDQKFASWGYFKGNRLITRDDFDARPANMYVSGENHGTSVAGVIAGEVDATHTVGAAPGCRLLPIRWESNQYGLLVNEDKLIEALDHVADKVDILSNSWGSTPIDDWPGVVVSLAPPSGKTVILHNRKGGSENGLKQTYDLQSLPQLNALNGESILGNWVLKVEGQAAMDRGQLNSWSLHLLIDPTEMIEIAEQPGVTIPDNQPEGIERSLQLAREGRIRGLEVSIDITHTYIGDLKVSLVAPDGAKALLHDRSGGGMDNLIRTYPLDATPALAALK